MCSGCNSDCSEQPTVSVHCDDSAMGGRGWGGGGEGGMCGGGVNYDCWCKRSLRHLNHSRWLGFQSWQKGSYTEQPRGLPASGGKQGLLSECVKIHVHCVCFVWSFQLLNVRSQTVPGEDERLGRFWTVKMLPWSVNQKLISNPK